MLLSIVFGIKNVDSNLSVDFRAIAIFAIIAATAFLYSKLKKAKISPIILIAFSGVLGVIFYGV